LAQNCTETAAEISEYIDSLSAKDEKREVLGTVIAAIRAQCNKERLATLANRLADYRSQLTLRILLVLNKNIAQQKPVESASSGDEIVEVVAINCPARQWARHTRPPETIAAIFTTRDDASTAIASRESESSYAGDLASGNVHKTSITFSRDDTEIGKQGGNQNSLDSKENVLDFYRLILDALHFRKIAERHSIIPDAHKSTFGWIWSASTDHVVEHR
jgi:hypothetical protein